MALKHLHTCMIYIDVQLLCMNYPSKHYILCCCNWFDFYRRLYLSVHTNTPTVPLYYTVHMLLIHCYQICFYEPVFKAFISMNFEWSGRLVMIHLEYTCFVVSEGIPRLHFEVLCEHHWFWPSWHSYIISPKSLLFFIFVLVICLSQTRCVLSLVHFFI